VPVRNITDPDSRLMPTRNGLIQGYNTQNLTSEDGLIIATTVTQDTTDTGSFQPMLDQLARAAALITAHRTAAGHPSPRPPGDDPAAAPSPVGLVLADAGYCSDTNINAPGPPRLIATAKHRHLEKTARNPDPPPPPPPPPPPGPRASQAIAAMTTCLTTEDGITAYRQRSHIAETPHGHIKHNMNYRQAPVRGKTKATADWHLTAAAHNLFKAITTGHLTRAALSQLHPRSAYPPATACQPA